MTRRAGQIAPVLLVAGVLGCGSAAPPNDATRMSFFITSARTGDGGNLGGLDAADAHCAALARAAGSPKREWRAYLSVAASDSGPAVNARDRIGAGPWYNVKGVQIARSVDDLHSAQNNLTLETALDEHGSLVNGRIHDMLTGSNEDGRFAADATCGAWTMTSGFGAVGHHNRQGGGARPRSWNSAHVSGCRMDQLQALGGDARFYCFAAD